MYYTSEQKIMRLEVGMTVYPIVQSPNGRWYAGSACQIIEIDDDESVYLAGPYSGRYALSDVALLEGRAAWYADKRNEHALIAA